MKRREILTAAGALAAGGFTVNLTLGGSGEPEDLQTANQTATPTATSAPTPTQTQTQTTTSTNTTSTTNTSTETRTETATQTSTQTQTQTTTTTETPTSTATESPTPTPTATPDPAQKVQVSFYQVQNTAVPGTIYDFEANNDNDYAVRVVVKGRWEWESGEIATNSETVVVGAYDILEDSIGTPAPDRDAKLANHNVWADSIVKG